MVDVSSKDVVRRTAPAYGKIILQKETINLVKSNLLKKGDVLAVAKIAGIMAGKRQKSLFLYVIV
jgi:molybdenum cofactor biosynthesis enzyme